jgi:hypothetical protein
VRVDSVFQLDKNMDKKFRQAVKKQIQYTLNDETSTVVWSSPI